MARAGLQVALLMTLATGSARAGAEQLGTRGAAFLAVESAPRALGMGGTGAAIEGGVESLRWNPAALASIEAQLGFVHAPLAAGLSHEWVAFASGRPAGGGGRRLALGIGFLRSDPLEARGRAGEPLGRLSAYGSELAMTWTQPLHGEALVVGVTGRLIREVIGEATGTGASFDLGVLVRRRGWRAAAVLAQLGPTYRFDGVEAPLPRTLRLGTAVRVRGERLLLAAALHVPEAGYAGLRLGAEWRLHAALQVRGGYQLEPMAPAGMGAGGPTFGATIELAPASVSYAYQVSGADLGSPHRIGLVIRFPGPRPSE